jgi:hypothetical protein
MRFFRVLLINLRIWLEPVKRVNPEVHAASTALDAWLGSECIAGGPLRKEDTLRIEVRVPAIVCEVEDVQDSEDGEQPDSTQPQATQQYKCNKQQIRSVSKTLSNA